MLLKFPRFNNIFGLRKIRKGVVRQLLTAFCAALSISCVSSAFVWIAPLQVRLKKPGSELYLTADEASWVVSLIEVGDLASTIPAGFMVDRVGRKTMILTTGPMLVFGWILILSTRSVGVLYIARVIQGLALGMLYSALPMYLAEIAGPEIRGSLGYFFQGMWYFGNLFEYSIGPFFSYSTVAWISLFLPIVFILTFPWFPESPYQLLMRGKDEEAGKVLAWLRGIPDDEVRIELNEIKESIEEEARKEASWKDLVTTKAGIKGLLLVHLVGIGYTMSGGTAMFSYATDTFERAGAGEFGSHYYTIILGSIVLFFVPFSGRLSDSMGRRPVMLVSCCGGALVLLIISAYFYLQQYTDLNLTTVNLIPVIGFISYTILIGAGIEAVFPVLQAELFPNHLRGVACGVSHFNITIASFACLKLYQVISDGIGMYFLFGIFAFFSLLGAGLIYIFVPETKGKTFSEIQRLLE